MQATDETLQIECAGAGLEWYAAYTKHQHEKVCADLISRKSIEVFLPVYQSVRKWRDRRKTIALPLFPSYLFFRTELNNRMSILTTPGVFFIVGNSSGACPISERDIESIRTLTNSRLPIRPHPFLRTGDQVHIKAGPLAGVRGILTRTNNKNRVVVCVEALRRAVSVEVGVEEIERSKAPHETSTSNRDMAIPRVVTGCVPEGRGRESRDGRN